MFDDFDTQEQIDEYIPAEWEQEAYDDPIGFIMGFAAMCTTARKIANKKKRMDNSK
jgi:hypothetical protein